MDAIDRQMDVFAGELRLKLLDRRRHEAATDVPSASIADAIAALVAEEGAVLPRKLRDDLVRRVIRETIGLGVLEELIADPEVEEVMVNGRGRVYIERRGRIEQTGVAMQTEEQVFAVIERILAPTGRRVDELSPMVDARLPDGSRVNVVVPPASVDGPAISIRRFGARRLGPAELVSSGTVAQPAADILEQAVVSRRTVLVTGGTGSGKTTLLNAMSAWIPPDERVITIEDAAELRLLQPHVVRLESRPASVEGRGEVTIRDLLRNALRMRPDRIVIGEVRGVEALDLLTALNTGHDGALSTLHANSPGDAIGRLETLALMAGVGLSQEAIREQIVRGVDVIAHVRRVPDGTRQLTSVAEVYRAETGPGVRELWPC